MPSDILKIEDEYLAFCFNEACLYIENMLLEKDKKGSFVNQPRWVDEEKKMKKTTNNKELIEWMKKHS